MCIFLSICKHIENSLFHNVSIHEHNSGEHILETIDDVVDCIRTVTAREYALLVPRGIDVFPSRKDRLEGTIDIWWVVRILDWLLEISSNHSPIHEVSGS